jgi:hypothetical protein
MMRANLILLRDRFGTRLSPPRGMIRQVVRTIPGTASRQHPRPGRHLP